MRNRLKIFLLTLVLGSVLPASADLSFIERGAGVYRLSADATFQEGCFDPCLCPIMNEAPLRGTFLLGRPVSGDVVDFREIRQINWMVGPAGMTSHRITGSGNYRITNFGLPQQHALELELSIDGGEPQFFFSDFVPVDSNDGSIDITVSMNGVFCYDIVIRVSAAPVLRDEILDYTLGDGSTWQQGCFDPCDCLLEEPVPIRGSFGLVPLYDYGTFAEFAVVNLRLGLRATQSAASLRAYSGFGTYTLVQGFAGPAHAMTLTLRSPIGESLRFDSELANTAPTFPDFDIVLDMNDMTCFDRVLTLRARRPDYAAPMPMAAADDGRPH